MSINCSIEFAFHNSCVICSLGTKHRVRCLFSQDCSSYYITIITTLKTVFLALSLKDHIPKKIVKVNFNDNHKCAMQTN